MPGMARSTVLGSHQASVNLERLIGRRKPMTAGEFDHEEKGVHKAVCGCLDRTVGRRPFFISPVVKDRAAICLLLQNSNLLNADCFQITFILQQCLQNTHLVSLD